jgi:hypothetical protein
MIDIEGKTTIRLQLDDPGKAVATPVESHRLPDSAGADPCGTNVAGHTHLIGIFIMAMIGEATLLSDGPEGRRSLTDVPGV